MKLSALLSRAKGRDFYDTMFLMSQTTPDYEFLGKRAGITTLAALKTALKELVRKKDLEFRLQRSHGTARFQPPRADIG